MHREHFLFVCTASALGKGGQEIKVALYADSAHYGIQCPDGG